MQKFTKRAVLGAIVIGFMSLPLIANEVVMTAPQAYKSATGKELVLVDIRDPQEWKETGIATVAHPISMHQSGFLQKLDKLIGGNKAQKIALICATGARSAYIQAELKKRGFLNTISVAEGMLGGPNGTGWIPRGLPVKKIK